MNAERGHKPHAQTHPPPEREYSGNISSHDTAEFEQWLARRAAAAEPRLAAPVATAVSLAAAVEVVALDVVRLLLAVLAVSAAQPKS